MKTILHIDFDSYFASCEQQFNPKLRGKPIGVTAQNGRTCIIAASREAKKQGVKSPSRTFEALQIAPNMIFVPAQFTRYWEVTQKFLDICKDYSPFVELFSLDEVFMDITPTLHLFGGKDEIVKAIKTRIRNEIGEFVTVSVGISHNKLLAKLGSGMNKPNGITEITPYNIDEIYGKAELTDFCGIGERIALRLAKLGVTKPLQLRELPLYSLRCEFGNVEAEFLRGLALGIDNTSVIPYTEGSDVKSVGRNYCLPQNEYDKRVVLQNIYELCEEIAIKLRRLNKKAKTAGIYLGGSQSFHGRKTINEYFNSGQELYNLCLKIFKNGGFMLKNTNYVRRIGIWVSNLKDEQSITLPLFPAGKNNENLLKTVDSINEKFGDHTIRNGFLLYADKLTTVPNGYMADTYERNKLAKPQI